MSRSCRKPWIVDNSWKYWGKRFASRLIRRALSMDIGENMNYKRYYQQYDICDYRWMCSPDSEFYSKCCRK